MELTTVWTVDGPFFERDPRKTVRGNIGQLLDKMAAAMEADVRGTIASHAAEMPGYSGHSWARTIGRRRSGRTGKHWALWAVVSANTEGGDGRVSKLGREDAIRTKAAAATIERRWHPYRTAARAGRRAIQTVDLTKGLE